MRVHLIKKKTIEQFIADHAQSRIPLTLWLAVLRAVDWKEPGDILKSFSSADLLGKGSNRVVFNIGGNNYRMICKYWFGKTKAHLYIKWLGTHAEYDALCSGNKQYSAENY